METTQTDPEHKMNSQTGSDRITQHLFEKYLIL